MPCKVVIVMSCVWKRVCPVKLLLSWLLVLCHVMCLEESVPCKVVIVMSCVWKRVCPVKLLLSCHVFGRECAL